MESEHYLTGDGIKIPILPETPGNLVLNVKSGGKRKHRADTQRYLLHLMLLHGLHYYWHGAWLVQRSGISISHSA